MNPEQIRAAAAARKAAAGRRIAQQDQPDPLELMRLAPAGQGAASTSQPINVLDPVQGDPTPVTAVLDNVVGLDNGVMSPGEKVGTAMNSAGESLTLGVVGDEAAAGFDSIIGVGSYDDRLKHYRGNQEAFREEHPMASFAAEIAPALIPGLGGAKLIGALTSKLGRAGAGAALGALSGLVYGAAEGEGGAVNRAKQGAATAALGSIVGGAAPKVIDGIAGIPKGVARIFRRSTEKPTFQTLKAAKQAAYHAVEGSGDAFSGDDMTRLHQRVLAEFDDGNYVEEVDNASRAALKILERRGGQETTLTQLDGIRQNLWKRYASAKDQPQILSAIKAIDDLIDEKAGASDLMGVARAANSRFAKYQLLDDAFNKAEDQTAATGSGGNILNKYRQAVSNIINSENKARWFSAEELGMMREFVRGSTSENVMRKIGKLSPDGNGLMMALHVVGGVASQGATLPLMAVGAGAKRAADGKVARGAENIKNVLAGFAQPSAAPQLTQGQGAAITGAVPLLENGVNGLREKLGQAQQNLR